MKKNELSVLILTFNEELHLERCINSLKGITNNIYLVDSYSSDRTIEIAKRLNVTFVQRKWKNYADQFQWGLDNNPFDTEWVMRMDCDEYLESDLINEIPIALSTAQSSISGFYINRKQFFLGRWIKHGDRYPLKLLRIWKAGVGRIEERWMDEHVVLSEGDTEELTGHIVDDNLNNTKWWTEKHNKYADREMIDILDRKYNLFTVDDSLIESNLSTQASVKRFIKEKIYNRLPIFTRPFLYFVYRYFLRLGFLDGKEGFAYHFFQGYWYRSLVDLRVHEAEVMLLSCVDNSERISILSTLTGLDLDEHQTS